MIRAYFFIYVILATARATSSAAPVDESRLNALATHYNRYVEQLRGGIVDLKEWERVKKAWEGLQ